jgi:hypothetical protein
MICSAEVARKCITLLRGGDVTLLDAADKAASAQGFLRAELLLHRLHVQSRFCGNFRSAQRLTRASQRVENVSLSGR